MKTLILSYKPIAYEPGKIAFPSGTYKNGVIIATPSTYPPITEWERSDFITEFADSLLYSRDGKGKVVDGKTFCHIDKAYAWLGNSRDLSFNYLLLLKFIARDTRLHVLGCEHGELEKEYLESVGARVSLGNSCDGSVMAHLTKLALEDILK